MRAIDYTRGMKLTVDVLPTGKTTATILLTQEQVDAIRGEAGRARVMLAITYKKQTFRTSVSIYNGKWMTVVNQQMREGGLAPGGTYTVDMAVDAAPRTVEIPADLAAEIKKAKLQKQWDALSYTNRKEFARAIEDAKKPETRLKRIEACIAKLSG